MVIRKLLANVNAVPAATPLEGEVILPTDTSQPMRLGMWILGVGFGGFLLWAGLAPLDEGVPTIGQVTIDTKRKTVQHLSGGIVKQVFVKEGQFVKSGDPLLAIDNAMTLANYESVRQHYLTIRAMEGRLMAEQSGKGKIAFHQDLLQASDDGFAKQAMGNQEQLFQSRRLSLQADQDAIKEAIRGQEASIQGAEGQLKARSNQLSFLQEELGGVRDLVTEGYAPRNKQLELERASAEATGSIADLQAAILRARRAISEMKLRAIQRMEEYNKEVDSQLSEVRREVQADADKFSAVSEELQRTVVRAPSEGQVLGLITQTVGGVIGPGQRLMDIVPSHEELLLEARVPPHLADNVHPGLDTDVRFSSFAHAPTMVIQAKVISVSSDLIAEQPPNAPYYLARIEVTPEGMKSLGNHHMQPGMPAEMVIKTGTRSVLSYLLHPLSKRLAASMKEE